MVDVGCFVSEINGSEATRKYDTGNFLSCANKKYLDGQFCLKQRPRVREGLAFCLRQHCRFLMLPVLLKTIFIRD